MWIIQPLQIADKDGNPTGRWRLTAKSDEDGGGPYGDTSHDHATAEEAEACDQCDEYCSKWSGFPSRKRRAEELERHERSELARLQAKYGENANVDLPDTAAQDSASKSNSPAVSG
jgi:hypothetical protein